MTKKITAVIGESALKADEKPKAARTVIDWERVEVEYRTGMLSLRELANAHGVSHVAIQKRANKFGWERDLSARIKAKAEALVNRAMVTGEVTEKRLVTEREVVDGGARLVATIQMAHRKNTDGMMAAFELHLAELHAQSSNPEELAALGELMRATDADASERLGELYQRVISLPTRTKTLRDLAETLKSIIGMQREHYRMDAPDGGAAEGRQLTDLEIAARMSYFVDLGRRRKADLELVTEVGK